MRSHFWPFTDVLQEIRREVTRESPRILPSERAWRRYRELGQHRRHPKPWWIHPSGGSFENGYDESISTVKGRFWYVQLKKRF